MPKVTITYDLEGENAADEERDLHVAMQAKNVLMFLWEFEMELRSLYKYHENLTEPEIAMVEKIREIYFKLKEENGVKEEIE